MASLNPLTREVVFKLVFYGPGLGGKTTTLQHIHAASKPEHRGKMVSLATPMDRTLYFDFLPLRMPLMRGMNVRLQLFTVPGQVYFGATRKLVLTGADGVVFVADSQVARQDANQEALEDLVMNLAEHNLALMSIPHAFHWNKRDLPDVVAIPELERTHNRQGAPSVGTIATSGDGVFPGLERITQMVLHAYESELPRSDPSPSDRSPSDRVGIEETTIADALRGLAEAPTRSRITPTEVARAGPISSPASPGPPPSSLESIPNPIPRRQSGSMDAASNGVPSSGNTPSSKGAPSSRRGVRGTPPPAAFEVAPSTAPSPTPPDVTASPDPATIVSQAPPRSGREAPTAALPPPTRSAPATPVFSFGPLWAETDRDWARQAESALATGDYAGALLASDVLLTRLLAFAASLTGSAEASRDPALVVVLLGLDGRRYLAFRAAVRAARAQEAVSQAAALEAYAFSIELRRAITELVEMAR